MILCQGSSLVTLARKPRLAILREAAAKCMMEARSAPARQRQCGAPGTFYKLAHSGSGSAFASEPLSASAGAGSGESNS